MHSFTSGKQLKKFVLYSSTNTMYRNNKIHQIKIFHGHCLFRDVWKKVERDARTNAINLWYIIT